ncbi:hypothetical protein HFO89_08740 [Rhizobium leguminosarum]|uniref:SMI1/KNR4 family protein n=1 Tax=Rhizobium leguminosarum TaxID=384 RepID=UPI001C98C14E|nr:SMI1/KNR4 family protein [Rhizobium leguminosarum]MBY5456443.1 hypothetical protein [Rhizobium leguminosarum]
MPDVAAVWDQIERWYSKSAPQSLDELAPPAGEPDLSALKLATGVSLPTDLRASLLRHNGGGSIHGYDYLDADWAAELWQRLTAQLQQGDFEGLVPADATGARFTPVWWSPKWLPVAEHRAGTIVCVDTAPGPQGSQGQILQLELNDEGPSATDWRSFAEWLDAYRGDLEAGKYLVDADGNLDRIAE